MTIATRKWAQVLVQQRPTTSASFHKVNSHSPSKGKEQVRDLSTNVSTFPCNIQQH